MCPNNRLSSSRDGNIANMPSKRGIAGRVSSQPHGSPETIHTRRTAGLLHRCGRARNQLTAVGSYVPVSWRSDEVELTLTLVNFRAEMPLNSRRLSGEQDSSKRLPGTRANSQPGGGVETNEYQQSISNHNHFSSDSHLTKVFCSVIYTS